MIQTLLALLMLSWAGAALASFSWADLWRTPNQQAQALLDKARPAEAAKLFQDPRHRAYAELQAGNYALAAKDFAKFNDSDDQYNRGNALARAGHLREAIQAYDAALARNPNNRDAHHNRDLVAKALQKQQERAASEQQQNPSGGQSGKQNQKSASGGNQDNGGGKQGSEGGKQDANSNNRNGTGDKGGASSGQDKKTAQAASGGNLPQSPNPKSQQGKTGQSAQAAGQDQAGQQKSGRHGQIPSAQAETNNRAQPGPTPSGQTPEADSAAEVRRDAEAALGKGDLGPSAADAPISEQQLAREQWLRRIPDDPGGLLRRKFMIEHMLRQQAVRQGAP